MNASYRPALASDAESISALVERALVPDSLPGWTPAAVDRLFEENSPAALRIGLTKAPFAHVCVRAGSVVGFVATRNSRLLTLLVVDPSCQRTGIGSELVRRMLAHVEERAPDLGVVEVNATEYSLPFYRGIGFHPISEFIEFEGCRFVRLGYWRKNPLRSSLECRQRSRSERPFTALDLVEHRSAWNEEFRQLAARLRRALGDLAVRIDHIGSTAVPSICAKDIIDVQVTVADLAEASAALRAAGFVERGDIGRDHVPPGYSGSEADWSKAYFTEPIGLRRANVHVRRADKPNQRYALLFRDYLLSHPDTARAYAELKRRLASSLADPAQYPEVKDPAVDLVYLAAEAWARESGWEPASSDA